MPVTQQENGGGGRGAEKNKFFRAQIILLFAISYHIYWNSSEQHTSFFFCIYLCYAGNGDILRILPFRVDPKIRNSPITI